MTTKKKLIEFLERREYNKIKAEDIDLIFMNTSSLEDEVLDDALDHFDEIEEMANKILSENKGYVDEIDDLDSNNQGSKKQRREKVLQAVSIEKSKRSKQRLERIKSITLKAVVVIGVGASCVYKIAQAIRNSDNSLLIDSDEDNEDVTGKSWNKETGRWEVDGQPISYRVTWRNFDDSEEHEQIFNDVDQAYDFYQSKRKGRESYGATYEHLDF